MNPIITINGFSVFALKDGEMSFDVTTLIKSNPPELLTDFIKEKNIINPSTLSINCFLLQKNDQNILIDTGAGELFGNHSGKLVSELSMLGIYPKDITSILITHIHNDHTGGLISNEGILFPNAELYIHENEINFWLNAKENFETESQKKSAMNAQLSLAPYLLNNKVKVFKGDEILCQSFKTIEMFGHTPGHSLFELSDKKNTLIFCADLLHFAEIQLKHPEWKDVFDIDPENSNLNRKMFIKKVAENNTIIAGAHLPFPGIGFINNEMIWQPV